MTRRCCLSIALFSLFVAFASSGFSQNASTSLRGTIKDPSGAVVPGATITLSDSATGFKISTTSGGAGEYQLTQLTPAKYTITVSATGFAPQSKLAELLVNQPATIDFTVSVQATEQVVNVTSAAQTLNTTDASLGNAMGNTMIQSLPSETRNVPDLLSLQPGVLYLGPPANPQVQDSRNGSVNGGRSDQGNITLDGVDDNDQVNGYAFTGVLRETQDSIEEFRVTTGNANADAGRSSGAQVSLITKAGTNQFHGAAYEYNRPTITVANNWFNKQAQLNSGEANIPGKLIRNIFGADLGGPIKKDKLFFFVNYEASRIAENTQVTQTTPTASYTQGLLTYTSGGQTETLTSAQVTNLDQGCSSNGVCPWGPGADPYALEYFTSMPVANGSNEGDGGYNSGSYSFSSPNPISLNTSIAKIDYTPSTKHHLFVRGNLQKDTTDEPEQFPGQGPSFTFEDNTKGITAGETWSINSNTVNDIRYGYIRQGNGSVGVGSGDYVDFRFLSSPTAETRTTIASVPVNNIVDNFNWARGKHDFQVGGNWRLIHQNRLSDLNSYNVASTNPYWFSPTPPPQPTNIGAPAVDQGFSNSYQIAYSNLVGNIPSVTDVYNYKITGAGSGALLGDGTPLNRRFKSNEYEYYLQDSWRAMPNLTLTFGIRHSILQTPWETTGQEVTPTVDTHTWYQQREASALQGQVYEPNLTFAPAGPYYNKPGFWPKSKNNIAPRFAVAYSPDSKTSIRAGFGIYYDHYGESLVNIFDQQGSFGLSSQLTNPAGVFGYEDAPRYTGRHNIPFNNGIGPSPITYPYSPPGGAEEGFQITWGLDSKLKTPYSEAIDFSVQRELPSGFTIEAAYVGRMGRHLLQSLDLAEPVDYVDPLGGGDYFAAGSQLAHLVDVNGDNPSASVPAIRYFEDVFPFMAGIDYPGESATQAIYTNEWAPDRATSGATTGLADIDFYCSYGCPAGYQSKFWQQQFSSLYALSTIGMSYYNAGQITLRHPSSHGLQTDISYTYSRSIDMGSDAERNTEFTGTGSALATAFNLSSVSSSILNTWKPYLNRAVSDFDTTHLLTIDWVYQLPVGRGQHFAGSANGIVNGFIGGWEWSGITRVTSGLPFSLFEPGFTTNWQQESYGVVTSKVQLHRHFDQNGNPQFFANPDAINNGLATGSPVRLPYPGEAGERNNFRGDGYLDLDSGLTKSWKVADFGALKFAWEVYNVTNTVRFDPASISTGLTGGSLGIASALLTTPRRMQFALRFDF